MGGVSSSQPTNLVDLFLDFETLQIVEFRFMTLKRAVEVIVAALYAG